MKTVTKVIIMNCLITIFQNFNQSSNSYRMPKFCPYKCFFLLLQQNYKNDNAAGGGATCPQWFVPKSSQYAWLITHGQ